MNECATRCSVTGVWYRFNSNSNNCADVVFLTPEAHVPAVMASRPCQNLLNVAAHHRAWLVFKLNNARVKLGRLCKDGGKTSEASKGHHKMTRRLRQRERRKKVSSYLTLIKPIDDKAETCFTPSAFQGKLD